MDVKSSGVLIALMITFQNEFPPSRYKVILVGVMHDGVVTEEK